MRHCKFATDYDWHGAAERVGNDAIGAVFLAWVWAAKRESDGLIPMLDAHKVAAPCVWRLAIAAGLAEECRDAYLLTGFVSQNGDAAHARAVSAARRAAGSRGGKNRWAKVSP